MHQKTGSTLVSVVVVAGFVLILTLLLVRPISLNEQLTGLLQIMLGTLAAMFSAVVQYHIGSSSGSKSKDDTIREIATKGNP